MSVCVVMIPSVIAYAELAGLSPVQGLYTALAAMIGYALFASSREVIAGPDAALTLLLAAGVGPLAAGDPSRAAALFLLFLTPVLRGLPTVALASILISAGVHLIEVHEYRVLARASRLAPCLTLLVAAGVLVVGVVPGIVIGVTASLIYILVRLARPLDVVLREVPETGRFHDLGEAPEAETVPGRIAYRFYAPLFFANAEHFVQRVRSLIASSPHPVRWFVVDMQAVWEIGITAAEALHRLSDELEQQGIALRFARANRPLRAKLERIRLFERLGPATYYPSVHAAVEAFRRQTDGVPSERQEAGQ